MKRIFAVCLLVVATQLGFATGVVKGKISDEKTQEPLIGVNIESGGKGVISDLNGEYSFELPEGTHTLIFSYLGYMELKKEVSIQEGITTELNIGMAIEDKNILGNEVVITSSLFERKASEEVISIEVIKPKLIATTNPLRIDEVARRVPGLNIADGQANIRAGSGWSYGVGSRVAVVLDGLTILSPDRGDVKWYLLPTEAVGQIEVLKGASSVLYGSSAMNGTISLQTQRPTKTPVTRFSVFQSFITPPKRKETKWWDFPIPSVGMTFMRAHKPKDNFDYTVGASLLLNNTAYKNGLEYLTRFTTRLRWTSKKNPMLSWGLAGLFMYNKEYEFFYFQNHLNGAFQAAADNDFENIRLTVDPFVTIYDKKKNRHEFKSRTYFNRPSFDTKTILVNLNYQFSKNWAHKNLNLTTGVDEQFLWINIPAFVGDAKKTGNLLSTFLQVDKKYKRLTLTGGVRFELFKYDDIIGVTGSEFKDKNDKLKFYLPGQWRGGLNYQAAKNTYIRFNVGQAYRFPSFAERFVDENVGSQSETFKITRYDTIAPYIYVTQYDSISSRPLLGILPNDNLKPEYGWTAEIGFQQIIAPKNRPHYRGVFDAAFYWQEYKNLVETNLVSGSGNEAFINLRFDNVSRARIAGWELNFKNDLTFKKHTASFNVGYTYALPAELNSETAYGFDKVGSYLKYLFKYSTKQFGSDTAQQILKYRNRHLLTMDMEYTYNDFFTIGVDARYYSKMENFDAIFTLLPGISEFLDLTSKKGYFIMNTRTFFTLKKKHNIGVIVKNILNTEYWLRAGKLEQPRSITMQYRLEF
ncbi:MAG: hypothetical protein RL222_1898 [Bacteroidota bacterium]